METLTDKTKQNKSRKKVIAAFFAFLLFMWLCTLISKSIYVSRLPMVQTEKPEKKFVEHVVEAEGIVTEGGEQAVNALSGMRVESIFVHAGDRVEEGTPLFKIDTEDLKERMKEKETELAKLNYQISDLKANKELQAQKKQIEEQRAREDYTSADSKTGTAVGRAEEAKSDADNDLQNHLDNPVSITSDEDREKAWDRYNSWIKKEEELLKKIAEMEKVVTNLENPPSEDSDGGGESSGGESSGSGEKSEEDKKELEEAKVELEALREALAAHEKNKVSMPDFSGEDSAYESWRDETEALKDSAKAAGYSRDDAYADRDSALKNSKRGIDDTLFPENIDSTLEIYQLEANNLNAELDEYRKILKKEGEISAVAGGMVTDIQISVGGRTADTAAMLLTDDGVPCQFKLTLTKEQKKYVNLGDAIELTLNNSGAKLEARVDYLQESSALPGSFDLFISLPENEGTPGVSGIMKQTVTGESHSICIPVEALHEEDTRYYVYVLSKREGILGEEQYAERVNVRVKDKNDRFAAIEEGILDRDSEIITYSDQEIKRGDVVRYQE